VLTGCAAMGQDVFVVATGILKSIGQNGHRAKVTSRINLHGHRENGAGSPGGVERNELVGIAVHFAKQFE